MGANEWGEKIRGTARSPRALVALIVVALLILIPGALLFVAAHPNPDTPPANGPSQIGAFWDKPVHFIETGLANGTRWSVTLSSTTHSSTTTTIRFTWIVGVFPFSVHSVAGYTASPSFGNVTVGNRGATVHITFTPIGQANYRVSFTESGLSTGTTWWVNLNGTNTSAVTTGISFSAANGTYRFTTPALLSGTPGEQFFTTLTNGTVVVNGTNVSVAVPYLTQFFLTMGVTPAGAGNVTPNSGWLLAGTVVNPTENPAAGYAFLSWNGSGNGSYSGTNTTPAITMHGPIGEIATFGLGYPVDFQELGLADGTTWSVTFNGVTQSAFFVFLDFAAPNGTFPYMVAPIPGYHADSYRGNITVAGSPVTVIIHWVRVTYNVSFVESGLPSGTTWSISLNGSTQSAMSSTILFVESNGSFPFTVGSVVGYTANVTAGTVVVSGLDVGVAIGFSAGPVAQGHTVTFVETGLPIGSAWSVTLNGSDATPATTTAMRLTFSHLASGTYHFWVPDAGMFHPANHTGTVSVAGANVTLAIVFAGLGPAVSPAPGMMNSVEELVIFALIAGAVLIAAYLVYRRE
ncbi:MAG: hypothetical protein L3K14_09450 [Thermoplasmata archaeon]|nr:hypothetical protein [Thermoplasmata archaeon]